MTALWIILAVALVLTVLNLLPVGVDAAYADDVFSLAARIGPFRLRLLPKPPDQKPKKKKPPKPKKEKPKKKSAPPYAEYIRRALEQRKPPKLSQPALEVLAIVAYFQPVTRAYIDQVRGVDSAYTVTTLLERGLIEACGKLDAPGRPSLYRTSALFLRTMGMQSLDELPVLPDLSSDEGAEKLEQAISELRGRGEQMELTDTEEKPTGE